MWVCETASTGRRATVNWELFTIFVDFLTLPCVKGKDGSAASPVGALPDVSAAIPATELISKSRRQLREWLELGICTLVCVVL